MTIPDPANPNRSNPRPTAMIASVSPGVRGMLVVTMIGATTTTIDVMIEPSDDCGERSRRIVARMPKASTCSAAERTIIARTSAPRSGGPQTHTGTSAARVSQSHHSARSVAIAKPNSRTNRSRATGRVSS